MSVWDTTAVTPSDPITDLIEGMRMIKDERWICRGCAATRWLAPYGPCMTIEELRAGVIERVYTCHECGSTDWQHTMNPVPDL